MPFDDVCVPLGNHFQKGLHEIAWNHGVAVEKDEPLERRLSYPREKGLSRVPIVGIDHAHVSSFDDLPSPIAASIKHEDELVDLPTLAVHRVEHPLEDPRLVVDRDHATDLFISHRHDSCAT